MENKKNEKKKSSSTVKTIINIKNDINNLISSIELEKIKIILDFLFYNTTKYYASFNRFKQCFFFVNQNFNLFSIFKEIVGKNHKYITIPRFLKAYVLFKSNKNKISEQLQKFFSFIINNLIKNWKTDIVGVSNNCLTYSSIINFSHNKRISNITLLKKDEFNFNINGIIIKYDNNFDCNLYIENSNMEKCLEISLDFIDSLKEYDGITHVFGCYSDKINLLGFKSRNGIIKYFGEKIGAPFIFGDFGKELICMKIKIEKEKGIIMIRINFKENNNIINYNIEKLNIICNKINKKEVKEMDELDEDEDTLFDEKFFNETNPMNDDIIKLNLVNDYYEEKKDINKISIYNNIYNFINDINEINDIENLSDDININNIKESLMKEIESLTGNKNKLTKKNSNSVINQSNKKNISRVYQKVQINSKQKKILNTKNITIENVINNKNLFEEIIKFLEKDIKKEIENENLKYEYDNKAYDQYLKNNQILFPVKIAQKNFNNYNEFKQVENEFLFLVKKNNNNDINKNDNNNKIIEKSFIYKAKKPKLKLDEQKIKYFWQKISEKLLIRIKIGYFFVILSILKLLKMLSFLENNNYINFNLKNLNLKQKILMYKIIIKNKSKVNIFNNKRIRNENLYNINKEDEVNINNDLKYLSDEELEKYNINDVILKLKIIKNIINENKDIYNIVIPLYKKYILIYRTLSEKENREKEKKIFSTYKQLYEVKNEIENNKNLAKSESGILSRKKYIKTNSNYFFSLSNSIIKNLEEIIDIEDTNIKIYKKQNLISTQLNPNDHFIDEIFPPSKTLFGISKNNNINIGKIEDILSSENIINNNIDYSILPEKEEFDKNNILIKKGLWQNYYFLEVIYSLLKYPSIIYKLFPTISRTRNGLYGVFLRINGIWKLIIIDDYIPYLVDQQYNKIFSYSSINQSYIWLILLEKAYTKLCGGYDNIQNGQVTEILDILTDTCTEKYELVCFNKLYLISKLKQDININKYIVFAKANSTTSYNIGLLSNGNYLIEEIKLFQIGEINEYVLKLRNNFSDIIYCGEWGRESKKWISNLKNEKPKNDFEFYISVDELINYFSSLYISKIHPIENGNEYFSEYIHYSKNEINIPNIAILDISKDTNIIIQFHQKNPKYYNINIISVTSYMIITDIDCEYIDSVSSVESNYSIELNLTKGKYFLISDIIYRYIVSIDNFHGYTINTYSKEKINLLKNNENNLNLNLNHKEIIKNAVINYSNKSLAPKRDELDLDIYEQNLKNRNKFPFLFVLFDNSSSDFDKNINIKINNINDSISKNYAYYLDFENLNNLENDEINDSLSQKEIKLIMILKLKEQFNFKINYHITPKITEEQLIEYTKMYGVDEELDEEGKIIQYLIEYDDGFIVLIENKYIGELFKMKLIMTGLKCINLNTEKESVVYFELNPKETKLFKLKTIDKNNSGVVSFQFQFAD